MPYMVTFTEMKSGTNFKPSQFHSSRVDARFAMGSVYLDLARKFPNSRRDLKDFGATIATDDADYRIDIVATSAKV